MKIKNVTDPEFRRYGRIVDGYDFTEMIKVMEQTPLPEEVIYVPSDNKLEKTEPAIDLKMRIFGELPIQIGYCNGHNSKLNALEYHRSSEVNVAVTDIILLLGSEQDIASDFTYETSKEQELKFMEQPFTMHHVEWMEMDSKQSLFFHREQTQI